MAALLLLSAGVALASLQVGVKAPQGGGADDELHLDAVVEEGASSYALELLDGAACSRRESDRPLPGEGERVLEGYRLRGDCIVAQAGYLDLSGKVWGCVVQGAGWVDLCVIREGDEGGSEVVSWHMDADDVVP